MDWGKTTIAASLQPYRVDRRKQLPSSQVKQLGAYPVVDQGQHEIAGFTDDSDRLIVDGLPVIVFGDHTRVLKYIDFPFVIGGDGTKLLKPRTDVFGPRFFYFALKSLNIPARGYNRHYTVLAEKELPVPPLDEQRKIATVLNLVQRAIEQQERLIALTTELKQTLLHKLFTEGPYGEPQKMTEIGLVPESWEVAPLGECSTVQTGIAKGRGVPESEAVTLPYLRVANVQDGRLDLSEIKTITIRRKEKDRFLLRYCDVLMTEGGDLDKLGRGFIWRGEIPECVHQNHVFAVRVDRTQLLPEFFAYQTQSPYGKAYFLSVAHKTTNLASINTTKLKGFPVLVPSLPEQQESARILQTLDQSIQTQRSRHELLKEVFRTLLHQLMTAQVRVDDLDLSALPIEDAVPA